MSWISFHIRKGNHFISQKICFISMNNMLEISSIRDISGYLKIYQDISGYLFGVTTPRCSTASVYDVQASRVLPAQGSNA